MTDLPSGEFEFGEDTDARSRFIDEHWPTRHATDIPGTYTTPEGELHVFLGTVTWTRNDEAEPKKIVTWKEEDTIDGVAVGPVELTDAPAPDAHPVLGRPYDPDRKVRWVTRADALALAFEHGAEFRES